MKKGYIDVFSVEIRYNSKKSNFKMQEISNVSVDFGTGEVVFMRSNLMKGLSQMAHGGYCPVIKILKPKKIHRARGGHRWTS